MQKRRLAAQFGTAKIGVWRRLFGKSAALQSVAFEDLRKI